MKKKRSVLLAAVLCAAVLSLFIFLTYLSAPVVIFAEDPSFDLMQRGDTIKKRLLSVCVRTGARVVFTMDDDETVLRRAQSARAEYLVVSLARYSAAARVKSALPEIKIAVVCPSSPRQIANADLVVYPDRESARLLMRRKLERIYAKRASGEDAEKPASIFDSLESSDVSVLREDAALPAGIITAADPAYFPQSIAYFADPSALGLLCDTVKNLRKGTEGICACVPTIKRHTFKRKRFDKQGMTSYNQNKGVFK